jgi:hypothetical protein
MDPKKKIGRWIRAYLRLKASASHLGWVYAKHAQKTDDEKTTKQRVSIGVILAERLSHFLRQPPFGPFFHLILRENRQPASAAKLSPEPVGRR